MGKTLLYILVLAALGAGVYFLVFKKSDTDPYDSKEAGFTVKDTAEVGKIFLANNYNESVLVERTDTGWVLDKQYKASTPMVNMLLSTLTKQFALYPVTKSAFEYAVKVISTEGIKVEVYDRKGNKMKVFYVGAASANGNGTNMMMEGAKTPYVVQEHGFVGLLTPRYNCETKMWRDRTVINFKPEDIKRIAVQYSDNPPNSALNSYVVTQDNGVVNVIGDSSVTTGDPKLVTHFNELNKRRAGLYLTYFRDVSCEGFLNGATDMAGAITEERKRAAVDITNTKGKNTHMDIYWMPINRRSKNRTVANPDVPDDYDADRMYAVINNNADTVMIQIGVFSKILLKAFQFYQKDETPQQQPDNQPQPPRNVVIKKQ